MSLNIAKCAGSGVQDIALEHLRERRAGSLKTFLHLHKDDLGLALKRQSFDLTGAGSRVCHVRPQANI
jgi:hypothetical protein